MNCTHGITPSRFSSLFTFATCCYLMLCRDIRHPLVAGFGPEFNNMIALPLIIYSATFVNDS